MTATRFLQIHTLTSYTATLLNRDDSGLAKRLPYGNALRTRISSQCLKRHWRLAEDPHALIAISGVTDSFRSRALVTKKVIEPLRGHFEDAVVDALEPGFQTAVYGDKATDKKARQTLLFGEPELHWLAGQATALAEQAGGNAKDAEKLVKAWAQEFKKNIHAMRENTAVPAGLTGALFGRMVTSDTDANIAAPIHVAHSFTVHSEESETDYFTAMDDLGGEEPGADTIQDTELTSGLYYGYVVVDLPGLVHNLAGNAALAGNVVHNLLYLIAEVSPGAKLGSTAPYGRASFLLLEAGNRQPRSLAEAYRKPCAPQLVPAVSTLSKHLAEFDAAYATGERRRAMCVGCEGVEIPDASLGSLADLAVWARDLSQAG